MNNPKSPQTRLFKYHPVRFHILRDDPIWKQAVEIADQEIEDDRTNALIGISERIADWHQHGTSLLFHGETSAFPLSRVNAALDSDIGGESDSEELVFRDWHENGQQIFDLSQISALFLDSDANEVPLNSIKLPFNGFYMYWGAHLRLPSPEMNRFVDGCYVTRSEVTSEEDSFDLAFTTSIAPEYRWSEHSLLANLVIDAEGFVSCLGAFGETGTFRGIGAALSDGGAYPEELKKWSPFLPAALSMAANCLCYLSWDSAEITDGYPPEAPAKYVHQAQSAKLTERRRAQSKLSSLGFRRIKMCGEALAESIGLREGTAEVPPHWRRGHWRHQRHGSGRRQVKVIWIHPVVVNADKGGPVGGHVYVP
jgi:hypothetical protein